MTSNNTRFLLALSFVKGIGKKYLISISESAERNCSSVEDVFYKNDAFSKKYSSDQLKAGLEKADEQIKKAKSLGHQIIGILDDQYPGSLRCIEDSPPFLFCSGNIDLLKKESVSIIGTREPTENGKLIAERVTEWFVRDGWVITSGLAKGVDGIAHRSCLSAGGETISVLAHGLEKIYPAENKNLAMDIVSNRGLLISEYAYYSFVGKSNFVERDRIQAGLSKAVTLIQSDVIGGSLHASRSALKYGRYLIVIGQSSRDIVNKENKIGANLVLLQGTDIEKASLLKTTVSNLDHVIAVPNKDYLPEVSSMIRRVLFSGVSSSESGEKDLFS